MAVRRLHDRGLSGWRLLAALVPVVGQLYLLYEVTMDSEPGDNRYGPKSMKVSSGGVMPIMIAVWLLTSVLFLAPASSGAATPTTSTPKTLHVFPNPLCSSQPLSSAITLGPHTNVEANTYAERLRPAGLPPRVALAGTLRWCPS